LIDRHFIHVPGDATSVKVTFKTRDLECAHLVVLHVLQLVPGVAATGSKNFALEKYIRLKPHHEVVEHAAVKGGLTMEVCLCKFWSSVGSCLMDVEIEFHSVVLGAKTLTVTSAGPEALDISTPLRAESLSVAAKATSLRKFYSPAKHTIRTLDPARYLLPQERQIYELELQYNFEQGEKESVKCQPVVHGLSDLLYDSPFESQMWMVFDSNKQLMGTGDALHEYPVSLPKGKYTLRLSVRHDKRDALDKLKNLVVSVDFGLAKDVTLNVYATLHEALSSGSKYSGGITHAGFRSVLYVSPPTDKAPGAKAGDLLLGKITVAKSGEYKEECTLQYVVGKEADSEEDKEECSRTDAELLNDAIRDAQLGRLKKLREEKKWVAFDALAQQILQDHSGYLPLLKEILLKEEADGEDGQDAPRRRLRCAAAVRAANAVIEACNVAGLAAHYGVRTDSEDSAQKAVRKEMDKKKENLVEAILIKGERLAALIEPAPGRAAGDGLGGLDEGLPPPPGGEERGGPHAGDDGGRSLMQELVDTWEMARQWIAPKDAKLDVQVRYAMLASSVERRSGRPGAALAELLRVMKSKEGAPSKRVMEELRDLAAQVGWKHWQAYYEEMLLKCFPGTYTLF
jgi:tripeptidyl-peptidase II